MKRLRHAAIALSLVVLARCGGPTSPTDPGGQAPSIASVAPSVVSTTGGTTVTIQGTGFGPGATVSIGGASVAPASATATTITIVAPTRTAGATPLVVTSGGRTASATISYVSPSGANQAPVISNLRAVGPRVNQPPFFGDLGETLALSATVTNAEAGGLQYVWTAGAGTIEGNGPSATWRLPATLATVPSSIDVSLRVTEVFSENGIEHRNVATASVPVRVHDSQTEILDKGFRFLDRFSQSQYTVDEVLIDFSPTCDGGRGRRDEARDVANNRATFRQLPGYAITRVPPVTYNFGGACVWPAVGARSADACATFDVRWRVEYLHDTDDEVLGLIPKGSIEESVGRDFVTAVLENDTWRLCHSDYRGTRTVTFPSGVQRFAVVVW